MVYNVPTKNINYYVMLTEYHKQRTITEFHTFLIIFIMILSAMFVI